MIREYDSAKGRLADAVLTEPQLRGKKLGFIRVAELLADADAELLAAIEDDYQRFLAE